MSLFLASMLCAEVVAVAPAAQKPIVVVIEGAATVDEAASIRAAIATELGVPVMTIAESQGVNVQGTLLVSIGKATATLLWRDERGNVVTRIIELPSATIEVTIALLAGNLVRDQTTTMVPEKKPIPATTPVFAPPIVHADVPDKKRPFTDDRYGLSVLLGSSAGMNRTWADASGLAVDVQAIRRNEWWSVGFLTGVIAGGVRGSVDGKFVATPLAGTLEARAVLGSLMLEGGAAFGTVIFNYTTQQYGVRDDGFAPYLRFMGSFALPVYDHFDFVGRLGWATTFRKVSPSAATSPLDDASWTFLAGVRAHL
ncbi:MAG: hypothetical protein ACXWUG_31710 [Polyangiales bacterium]